MRYMMWQQLFDPENRFWTFMDKMTDVFILSICWLLFSLPVVTCGAATVALFQFTLKQVDNTEGYAFRSFRRAFVQNFRQATLLWLLFIAGCIFFVCDFRALLFYHMPPLFRVIAFAVVVSLAFLFSVMFCYAFPVLACFRVSVRKSLGNGLVMAFQHIGRTFCILAVYMFFIWLAYLRPLFTPLFFALALFSAAYLFRRIFNGYLSDGRDTKNTEHDRSS